MTWGPWLYLTVGLGVWLSADKDEGLIPSLFLAACWPVLVGAVLLGASESE